MKSDKDSFNGWTNYETWLAYCWLTCDENTQAMVQEDIKNIFENESVTDSLDAFQEYIQGVLTINVEFETSFVSDIVDGALESINYKELYDALTE